MTYDGFKEDILSCFDELIKEYELSLLDDPEEEGWYLLKNSKCILGFGYDRGDIGCAIKSKRLDFVDILKLYLELKPVTTIPQSGNPWDPINQLERYVFMIKNSKIIKILEGDDSWVGKRNWW